MRSAHKHDTKGERLQEPGREPAAKAPAKSFTALLRGEKSSPGVETGIAQPDEIPGWKIALQRAEEVIGDKGTAILWLEGPVRELDDWSPLMVLIEQGPKRGLETVLAVLTKLEHGVF